MGLISYSRWMMAYEQSHPWIDFKATDVNGVQPKHWMLVGEARSKCEHLAGVPLEPELARQLYEVTLIKGALATTAIEGNTLSEDQVRGILEGSYKAPPSRQYQEQEVRNVLEALQDLHDRIVAGEAIKITAGLIKRFNWQILHDTELRDGVVPGELRTDSVVVGPYRAAPPEDLEYLLDQLVDWLDGPTFESADPELQFALTLARAVYAHLYIAWIHPFGDGNGRTARLLEFVILAGCGMVPIPAAHLLSNHYNLTRDRYYRGLDLASKPGQSPTLEFLVYAIEGFVDGIREVIALVRAQQIRVAWVSYVHEQFAERPHGKATDRQRALVLAMGMGEDKPRRDLEGLTPKIAKLYAGAGPRVLPRDLNMIEKQLGLIMKSGRNSYRTRPELVLAFRPALAANGNSN
jgi:Fic family protein